MSAKVLLVDDDIELTGMLREYLERDGFAVDAVHAGEAAVAAALSRDYGIAVLDVMLPGMNGIEALQRIRAQSVMPVLMLTGRGDDADRIDGLELGADDYVPKPCTPRELAARIRAILRRTESTEPGAAAVDASPPATFHVAAAAAWSSAWRRRWAGGATNSPISAAISTAWRNA